MKKIIFAAMLLLSVLCLAACSEPCAVCVDEDGDGYCDVCFYSMPEDNPSEDNSENDDGENDDSTDNNGGNGTDENNGGNNSGSTSGGNTSGDSGDNTTGGTVSGDFTIEASSSVIALGEGSVTFSVKSGTADSVTYKINGNAIMGSAFTPTETGVYTVRAASGGKESSNSLTVTVLKSNKTLAREINAAFSNVNKITLGTELDIGLTAETAQYYSVSGEGYLKINADGKLEFIGLKNSGAAYYIKDRNGNSVAEGIYNMTGNTVLAFVGRALYNMGELENGNDDIPDRKLSLITELYIPGTMVTDSNEFYCLKYLTALKELNISGNSLGDLNYLRGLKVKTLNISMPLSLEVSGNGESIYDVICSLPELESLSMYGIVGYLNKESYNLFVNKVVRGELDIMMSYGAWMTDAESAANFSKTVYFSIDELRALQPSTSAVAVLEPAADFKHVIIVLGSEDTEKFVALKPTGASIIDLYGTGGNYYTPIFYAGSDELAVNMYNYSIDAYGRDMWGNAAIQSSQTTKICAQRGNCQIKGADSYPLSSGRTEPTEGITCYGLTSLTLSAANGAALTVKGGYGKLGEAGAADGSAPDSATKRGGAGGDGAVAIYCYAFKYGGGSVLAVGGDGNGGGTGGAGTKENSMNGGYNGGNGGKGGNGAVAISCVSNSPSGTGDYVSAESGNGGSGGAGGAGYNKGLAFGKDGAVGAAGSKPTNAILIRS